MDSSNDRQDEFEPRKRASSCQPERRIQPMADFDTKARSESTLGDEMIDISSRIDIATPNSLIRNTQASSPSMSLKSSNLVIGVQTSRASKCTVTQAPLFVSGGSSSSVIVSSQDIVTSQDTTHSQEMAVAKEKLDPGPSSAIATAPPTQRAFRPSRILLNQEPASDPHLNDRAAESGLQRNRTVRYKGEITEFDFQNVKVADGDNHALHLMDIHPKATFADIFSVFTGVKVFSFNRLAPDEDGKQNAAGNLVLMTRAMAVSLMAQMKAGQGVSILGQRISAMWNRHRVGAEALARFQNMSRVVCVKGPREAFDRQALLEFFASHFKFELVSSREWNAESGKKIVEYSFTSIRAQAENAVMVLRESLREYAKHPEEFEVWFSKDRCEVQRWRLVRSRGDEMLREWRRRGGPPRCAGR